MVTTRPPADRRWAGTGVRPAAWELKVLAATRVVAVPCAALRCNVPSFMAPRGLARRVCRCDSGLGMQEGRLVALRLGATTLDIQCVCGFEVSWGGHRPTGWPQAPWFPTVEGRIRESG